MNLELVLVPAGEFILGDAAGEPDESPECRAVVDRPFYLGRYEVTNAEYAVFRPAHDSGVISQTNKDQNERGIPVNAPRQPVVRVTWNDATAFCDWLVAPHRPQVHVCRPKCNGSGRAGRAMPARCPTAI